MTQIFEGFQLIGQSLVKDPSIWWFLTPVFILWIVMDTKKKNWAGTASWPMEFPLPGLILPLLEFYF